MDNKKIIGSRINSALAMNNILQKELAKQLNVKDNIVSYWCKGDRTPNTSQIIQIANYLNVSTDYLLGVTDVATTDKDLKFVCDYTGLKEETIKLLSFEQNEHKNNLSSDNAFDETLHSIIVLYFEKLYELFYNFQHSLSCLRQNSEHYTNFVTSEIQNFQKLADVVNKNDGKNINANKAFQEYSDSIKTNLYGERYEITLSLKEIYSILFQLQDIFITYVKGLFDANEPIEKAQELENSISFFKDIEAIKFSVFNNRN